MQRENCQDKKCSACIACYDRSMTEALAIVTAYEKETGDVSQDSDQFNKRVWRQFQRLSR